jgi:hypothetical protein
MSTIDEENTYLIPGNRQKTDEHRCFLRYYNEKILHEQDKIAASSNSITYDAYLALLLQIDQINSLDSSDIDSIKEKAALQDAFYKTLKGIGLTEELPIVNVEAPAVYAQKDTWLNFIADFLVDFLRDGVMIIKKEDDDIPEESFPFTNTNTVDIEKIKLSSISRLGIPGITITSLQDMLERLDALEIIEKAEMDKNPEYHSLSHFLTLYNEIEQLNNQIEENQKKKKETVNEEAKVAALNNKIDTFLSEVSNARRIRVFLQLSVKFINFFGKLLYKEGNILNESNIDDLKLLGRFLFSAKFENITDYEPVTTENILQFNGPKLDKIAQILKILTFNQQNCSSLLQDLNDTIFNLESTGLMVGYIENVTIYDLKNNNIVRIFKYSIDNMLMSSATMAGVKIPIGYYTNFLKLGVREGFNLKNTMYIDLFNNRTSFFEDLTTFGKEEGYFQTLIDSEVGKIQNPLQEPRTDESQSMNSSQSSQFNFTPENIEKLTELLKPTGLFFNNLQVVINFFNDIERLAKNVIKDPREPIEEKKLRRNPSQLPLPNNGIIEPYFHDTIKSNEVLMASSPPNKSALFIDILQQLSQKLLNDANRTIPLSKLLDFALILDIDMVFPELTGDMTESELTELLNNELLLSITFQDSTPKIELHSIFPTLKPIKQFTVDSSSVIPRGLIENLKGTNLYIIFVTQKMKPYPVSPGYKPIPDVIVLLEHLHDTSSEIMNFINQRNNFKKMLRLFVYNQSNEVKYQAINLFAKMLFMKFLGFIHYYIFPEVYKSIFKVFVLFGMLFLQSPIFQPAFDFKSFDERGITILSEYSYEDKDHISPIDLQFYKSFVSKEFTAYAEKRAGAARNFASGLSHIGRKGGARNIKTRKTSNKSAKKHIKKINNKMSNKKNSNPKGAINKKNIKSKKLKQKKIRNNV